MSDLVTLTLTTLTQHRLDVIQQMLGWASDRFTQRLNTLVALNIIGIVDNKAYLTPKGRKAARVLR